MASKSDGLKLEKQLCFPLYLCSKEIIRKYTPYLEKINLTYTQYIVMMYFWENKSCNVKTLSKSLLLDSGTLTPLLKKLEQKGYIKRQRSEVDERNLILTLTEDGNNIKSKAIDIPNKVGKCLGLSEKEAKELYTIIYKILVNIQKEEK